MSNNNFSIELGGKALAYSIGYERTIYKSKKLLLTGNINVTSEAWLFEGSVAIIPISISTLIGEKRNKLLVGLDATTAINYSRSDIEFIQLSIGYRRYFKKGNSLSIALTLVAFSNSYVILPMFSINYNFKL